MKREERWRMKKLTTALLHLTVAASQRAPSHDPVCRSLMGLACDCGQVKLKAAMKKAIIVVRE
jgi:hypothetical protein